MAPNPLEYAPPPSTAERLRASIRSIRVLLRSPGLRRGLLVLVVVTVIFISIGYWSNSVSRAACEARVAQCMSASVFAGRPVPVRPGRFAETLPILEAAGVRSTPLAESDGLLRWGEVRSGRDVGPFLVEVEYGWMLEAQFGGGGVCRFLCFFGHLIGLAEQGLWAS